MRAHLSLPAAATIAAALALADSVRDPSLDADRPQPGCHDVWSLTAPARSMSAFASYVTMLNCACEEISDEFPGGVEVSSSSSAVAHRESLGFRVSCSSFGEVMCNEPENCASFALIVTLDQSGELEGVALALEFVEGSFRGQFVYQPNIDGVSCEAYVDGTKCASCELEYNFPSIDCGNLLPINHVDILQELYCDAGTHSAKGTPTYICGQRKNSKDPSQCLCEPTMDGIDNFSSQCQASYDSCVVCNSDQTVCGIPQYGGHMYERIQSFETWSYGFQYTKGLSDNVVVEFGKTWDDPYSNTHIFCSAFINGERCDSCRHIPFYETFDFDSNQDVCQSLPQLRAEIECGSLTNDTGVIHACKDLSHDNPFQFLSREFSEYQGCYDGNDGTGNLEGSTSTDKINATGPTEMEAPASAAAKCVELKLFDSCSCEPNSSGNYMMMCDFDAHSSAVCNGDETVCGILQYGFLVDELGMDPVWNLYGIRYTKGRDDKVILNTGFGTCAAFINGQQCDSCWHYDSFLQNFTTCKNDIPRVRQATISCSSVNNVTQVFNTCHNSSAGGPFEFLSRDFQKGQNGATANNVADSEASGNDIFSRFLSIGMAAAGAAVLIV